MSINSFVNNNIIEKFEIYLESVENVAYNLAFKFFDPQYPSVLLIKKLIEDQMKEIPSAFKEPEIVQHIENAKMKGINEAIKKRSEENLRQEKNKGVMTQFNLKKKLCKTFQLSLNMDVSPPKKITAKL